MLSILSIVWALLVVFKGVFVAERAERRASELDTFLCDYS